tara:strand:- start:731 stop:1216 length:486 start_codon:yes stop_codon:yes gene_type:complete
MKVTEYEGHKVPEGATKFRAFHSYLGHPDRHEFYKVVKGRVWYFDYDTKLWTKATSTANYDGAIELPEQPTKSGDVVEHDNNNKYSRKIKTIVVDGIDHDIYVDVYDVLTAFKTTNKANDHAIKKQLATGQRGIKGVIQDLTEARDSLNRAIEIEKAKGGE